MGEDCSFIVSIDCDRQLAGLIRKIDGADDQAAIFFYGSSGDDVDSAGAGIEGRGFDGR
ncbi:MAG: hypothetical protein RID07_06400 [Lacipirellulaceae bacterium]